MLTAKMQKLTAFFFKFLDCLHYCSPGVPNEWLGFMWHMMITQAENGDYDDPPLGDSWIVAGMPT
jgi:hypothetical protein